MSIYGQALTNGVLLQNDHGVAISYLLGGNIINEYTEKKQEDNNTISKIPLLRGLHNIINGNMELIFMLAVILIFEFMYKHNIVPVLDNNFILYAILTVINVTYTTHYFLNTFLLNKTTKQFHACEHMVVNAYDNGMDLTLDNVRQCKRSYPRCGTNPLVGSLILSAICYPCIGYASISFVISCMILFELSRFSFINNLVIKIGGWVQEHFTTINPSDDQIKVAISCLETLINFEKGVDIIPKKGYNKSIKKGEENDHDEDRRETSCIIEVSDSQQATSGC